MKNKRALIGLAGLFVSACASGTIANLATPAPPVSNEELTQVLAALGEDPNAQAGSLGAIVEDLRAYSALRRDLAMVLSIDEATRRSSRGDEDERLASQARSFLVDQGLTEQEIERRVALVGGRREAVEAFMDEDAGDFEPVGILALLLFTPTFEIVDVPEDPS